MSKEKHIEDADIVVDLSGGRLAAQEYRKRIADLQSALTKSEERIKKMSKGDLGPESILSGYSVLVKSLEERRDELRDSLTTSEAENIEWQEQIAELCIESASQGIKLTTATDTIKRLRIAISGLLFSFNRHWIRMSLDDCRGTSPSEVAQSVVNAEQALKPEQEIEP